MKSWKTYRNLRLKKFRDQSALFLVEGRRLCREALKSEFTIEAAFMSASFTEHPEYKDFRAKLDQRQIATEIISDNSFRKLSATAHPQGILLVAGIPRMQIDSAMNSKLHAKILLVENIQDPGNIGTIIRTAHWFGFQFFIASAGSADLYSPKTIRASMGSVFHIRCGTVQLLDGVITELKKAGYFLIGTSPQSQQSVHCARIRTPFALLLGSEAHGLSRKATKQCHTTVRIPKFGTAESLNVAVAAGILMNQLAHIPS